MCEARIGGCRTPSMKLSWSPSCDGETVETTRSGSRERVDEGGDQYVLVSQAAAALLSPRRALTEAGPI